MAANSLTNYLETAILNHIFNKSVYTAPTTFYLALYTTSPTDNTPGTEVVAGNGYPANRNAITLGTVTNSTITNTNSIAYTATGNWGTVNSIAIVDYQSTAGSGNQLWYGPLSTPRTIINGDTFTLGVSSVTLTLD